MQPDTNAIVTPSKSTTPVTKTPSQEVIFNYDLDEMKAAIDSGDLTPMPTIKTLDDFDKWLND